MWTNQKPEVSNLRIFGSEVMMHIPKEKRLKWDKKSKKTILVGFSENIKRFRLYDLETKKVIISRDVIINEKLNKKDDIIIYSELSDSVGESNQPFRF